MYGGDKKPIETAQVQPLGENGQIVQGYSDDDKKGNVALHLYNELLSGAGNVAAGAGDLLALAGGATAMGPGVSIDNALTSAANYRNEVAPNVREFLKDKIGADVDKSLEAKYRNQTLTGALGGLAQSLPSIAATVASGGFGAGAMFLQSYDGALQSLDQSEVGQTLDPLTKTIYATGIGTVSTLLEKAGLDRIMKGNSTIFSKLLTDRAIAKATKETGGKVTGDVLTKFLNQEVVDLNNQFVKGGAKVLDSYLTEYATGASQEIANIAGENLINYATGKPVFDTSKTNTWQGFIDRVNTAGNLEGLGGGLLGTVAALGGFKKADINKKQTQISEINTAINDENVSDVTKEVLVQQKIKLQEELENDAKVIDEAFNKLDSKQKDQVLGIVEQKAKIEEVMADAKVPEDVKTSLNEEVKVLDKELAEIKPLEEVKPKVDKEYFDVYESTVKEAKTVDEAFKAVTKNGAVLSDTFNKKYNPKGELTPQETFSKFYNEIKPVEEVKVVPSKEPTEVKEIVDKEPVVLFHGTPHKFEGFKSNKIGTGEGNQAFGAGLYFTNKKEIAKNYAEGISSKKKFWDYLMDGNDIELSSSDYNFIKEDLDALGFDGSRAEDAGLSEIKVDGKLLDGQNVYDAMSVLFGKNAVRELEDYDLSKEQIDRLLEIKKKITDPQLYEVSLKDENKRNFIEWESSLSDKMLSNLGDKYKSFTTGKDLYNGLVKELGNQQKASDYLLSKGIDGIIYKSEKGTGGTDGKGRNYVVFDENIIQIDKINETPTQRESIQKEPKEVKSYGYEDVDAMTDADDIATALNQEIIDPSELTPIQQAIRQFGGVNTTEESYAQFGDKNNLTDKARNNFIRKKGQSLDALAQEISKDGLEVTPADLVDYIDTFAEGDNKLSARATALQEKLFDLTGKKYNKFTVKNYVDKINEKARKRFMAEPDSLTEEEIELVNKEGLNAENFDEFPEKMDWLYDTETLTNIKEYLNAKREQETAESNENDKQTKRSSKESAGLEEQPKTSKEKVADIEVRRQSIKDRISQKLKDQRGQMNSGIDPTLLKDFIDLGVTYIEEGIVNAADFIKRFREDAKDFGIDDAEITDNEITEVFNSSSEKQRLAELKKAEKAIGATKADIRALRDELGQEQYEYEALETGKRKAEATRLIKEGYNVADLINKLNDRPNATPLEVEILKQYYASLSAEINKNPTPENIKQRDDLLKTIDVVKTEGGRASQAWDGLTELEDNLANFLTQESQFVELTQAEIDQLSKDYNKAKEALDGYKKLLEEANAKAQAKLAQKAVKDAQSKVKPANGEVKEAFKAERKQYVEDFRAELKRIRSTPNAVILPYTRELIALAPFAKNMMQSYVREGVYDLATIVKGIHDEFVSDIPELTENDVRDIIAGQYPNPRNTKNAKMAQIYDLKRQAKLERDIELLEQGILETKNPVKKKDKSDKIAELEAQIKEIKKRNPELTAPSKLEARKTWLKSQIESLQEQIRKGEYDEIVEPVSILLDQEALKLKDEYIKFKEETRARRQHQQEQALGKWDKALKNLEMALATKRLVQTSIDLSIPFRQGVTVSLNVGYPEFGAKGIRWNNELMKIGGKGYGKMISAVKSENAYDRMMFDIENSPNYLESKDDGIVYNEVGSLNPEKRSEYHRDHFLYKTPWLGAMLKASERAAAGWTNYARYEMYLRGSKNLQAEGKTRENAKEAYEQMALRVMTDTGRGKLPKISDKASSTEGAFIKRLLGNTLYGARLAAATFRKLNPLYYLNPKVDKTVRIQAIKDMAGYTTGLIAVGVIARAMGYAVSFDWDDPDFMKLRKGKKVIDITGGQATYYRTFLRLVSAAYKQVDPTVNESDAKKYSKFAAQSLSNFWRNKLAPNTSYGVNAFMGENAIGEKFNPWEIIQIYPMYGDDIVKAFEEGSPLDLFTIIPTAISGIGYMEYEKDIRRANLKEYVNDKDIMKFLNDKQLNITGDINQEIYDVEKGGVAKMTREQSDKFEKAWSEYIIDEIKEDKENLDKLSPEKLKKEITKIKSGATRFTKLQIAGVEPGIASLTYDDKTYELTPVQVKERVKLNKEYIKDNGEDLKASWTEKYMEDGMSKKRAERKAVMKVQSLANSYSRNVLISEEIDANDGKITLKEKP